MVLKLSEKAEELRHYERSEAISMGKCVTVQLLRRFRLFALTAFP